MMLQDTKEKPKRAIVAAVQLPDTSDIEFEASLTELRQLAKTLGFEVMGTFTQKRAQFDPAADFGTGKREELRRFIYNKPEETESPTDLGSACADVVLVDHEISSSQSRNL